MWSNARELEFLEAYQRESILWNPKDARYKDKQLVHDAWLRISSDLDIPVEELKKKRDSLLATYRNHRRKVRLSLQSGAGAGSVYKPFWFAYDCMNSFLHDAVTSRKTLNTDTQVTKYLFPYMKPLI
ncbi:unnamed protein product [Parnassius mnemosyne]|uniref:MADF domain-containing protein n=1 Tax=Parnassius mnemosyne TaxID=213953 RepID=A0AAV1KFY4_9NEOP